MGNDPRSKPWNFTLFSRILILVVFAYLTLENCVLMEAKNSSNVYTFFPSPPCVRTFISQTYSLVPWEKWRKHLLVTLWLDMYYVLECTSISHPTRELLQGFLNRHAKQKPFFLKIGAKFYKVEWNTDKIQEFVGKYLVLETPVLVASNDLRRFLHSAMITNKIIWKIRFFAGKYLKCILLVAPLLKKF